MKHSEDSNYRRMIGSWRWAKLRRDVITSHPICQDCGIAFSAEVHHVTPCETATSGKEMELLMFDRTNLVALCHSCHIERHKQMGRSGRKAVKRLTEAKMKSFNARYYGEEEDE